MSALSAAAAVALAVVAVLAVVAATHRPASGFQPVPVSPCGAAGCGTACAEPARSDRDGTVVLQPWSTQCPVALERNASSPGTADCPNTVTGVGKGTLVRAQPGARHRLRVFEEVPTRAPGYVWPVGDGSMGVNACQQCPQRRIEIDNEFITDGTFGAPLLKEGLTSRRGPTPNTLTASRVGLGSTRLDPRFEPGPPCYIAGGCTNPVQGAPGSHAGGPSMGALIHCKPDFPGSWDNSYVFGYATDSCDGGPEALDTERSRW